MGQESEPHSGLTKWHAGSSLFMLGNLLPESPSFYQVNVGYWITPRDVLSIEAITWKYNAPLGVPLGSSSFESDEVKYPGSIREWGIGVAYQRFLWKDLYSSLHAVPFKRKYLDANDRKVGNGFQLFTTLRLGYHIRMFKNRLFIEPSIACTYWPVTTNVPPAFKVKDNDWPNYFLFEPGLHFGVKF